MSFIETARRRVKGKGLRIVYPEGLEERAMRAARQLVVQDLARPVLVGKPSEIAEHAENLGISLDEVEVRDPNGPDSAELVALYHDLRKHKGCTPEVAAVSARRPHYYAALLVRAGHADGFVSGLNSETKPFLPSFEVIGMREGFKRASSVFFMVWPDRVLFYADCSVNINPDAATLAEIGRATAATARDFGVEPRVAFLSFSTRDSAKDASIEKVKEAVALARAAEPGLIVDGELQFDAAYVPAIANKKCPGSPLEGKANVFVFPDLNAGNIAYKITERLAGAQAIGPVLQGLRQPVNDVSRGCSVQDLVDVAVVTAIQTGKA